MKKLCILTASLLAVASTWAAYVDVGLTNADFDACTQDIYNSISAANGGFDDSNYDVPGWMNYGTPADSGEQATGAWWGPYSGHSAFMKSGDAAYLLSPYVIQGGDQFNIGFMAKAWGSDNGAWTVTLFYGTDPSTNAIAVYNTGTLPAGNSVATWAPFGTNNVAATPASVGQTLGILFQSTGVGFANLDEVKVQKYVDLPLDFGNTSPANGATGVKNDVVLSCDVIDASSTFSSANLYLNSFTNAPVPASVISGGGTNTVTADAGLSLAPNSTNTAYVIANSPAGTQTNSWTFTMDGQYDITLSPAAGAYALAYNYQPTISAQVVDVNDNLDYVDLYTNGAFAATGSDLSSTTTVSVVSGTLDPGVAVTNMIIVHSAEGNPDVTNQWSFTMGGDTGITVWNSTTPPVGAFDIAQTNAPASDLGNISTDDAWTYVAGNRPAQGQFFTTPEGTFGYLLTSVWLRHTPYDAGSTGFGVGATAKLRITDPAYTNSPSFVKASETLAVINDGLASADGRWIQLKLANPVVLNAGKTYGFDLGSTSHFDTCGLSSEAYVGGSAYSSGANSVGNNTAMLPASGDRTFIVSLAESGAPLNIESFTPSGSGITNLVTLQLNFTQLAGTYDETNTKLYLDGAEQPFYTGGSSPNYSVNSLGDNLDPLTTHTGMVVLASSSPVSITTNYTYFTMADAFAFTGHQPTLNASVLTNETALSVKIIPMNDFLSGATMYLDGIDTGAGLSSSGGTNTLSVSSSGTLVTGPHTVMVVAAGGQYGDVTNSWNFNVQTATDDAVWNINFAGRTGVSATVADGTVLAAPSAGSNTWNNLIAPAINWNPSNAVTIAQANGSRTIGLDWVDDGGNDYRDWSTTTANGVTDNLFESYYGKGSFNSTMQITGLDTSASYDVYAYSTWGWSTDPVTFSLTQGYADTTTRSFTAVQANCANDYANIAAGQNYVIFTNVTPSLAGKIDLNLQSANGGWSGLQIVENPGQASLPMVEIVSQSPTGYSYDNTPELQVVIMDLGLTVNTSDVVLLVDGSPVTPDSVSKSGTTTTVSYVSTTLAAGTHMAGVVPAPGAATNEWSFTIKSTPALAADALWNVNFAGLTNSTARNVDNGSVVAAPSTGSNLWNNVMGASSGGAWSHGNVTNTFSGVTDATGGNPITVVTRGSQGWGERADDNMTVQLFQGWAGANVPCDYDTDIGGLDTNATYDLYVYSTWRWNENDTVYTLTEGTADVTNGVVTHKKSNIQGDAATDYTGIVEGENYFIFTEITPAANGHIVVHVGDATDTVCNGFQLVKRGADPVVGPSISITTPAGGSSMIMSWTDGFTYNVLTNGDLSNPNGWGVMTTGTSPITNSFGSESQLFYKLSD